MTNLTAQFPAFNDAGQSAILTLLTGTSGAADDLGLDFHDDTLGLMKVAREGDPLLGSTISDLAFDSGVGFVGDERSGFNEHGQVAYRFTLADGREGVAVWSPVVALVADYNADGFVSQSDLDLVLLNWGDSVAPAGFDEGNLPGGGPFDGLVSQNELDGVLLNWGNGTPPPVNAIPEPSAGLTLILGASGLACFRGGGCRSGVSPHRVM